MLFSDYNGRVLVLIYFKSFHFDFSFGNMQCDFAAYLFTLLCPLFTSGASFSIAHEYSLRKVNCPRYIVLSHYSCNGLRDVFYIRNHDHWPFQESRCCLVFLSLFDSIWHLTLLKVHLGSQHAQRAASTWESCCFLSPLSVTRHWFLSNEVLTTLSGVVRAKVQILIGVRWFPVDL